MNVDLAAIKDNLDLRDQFRGDPRYRKHTARELCGPCPVCGGTDRFWVAKDYWGCRQCGTGGDAIHYVMWRNNITFLEALDMLATDMHPAQVAVAQTPVQRKTKELWPRWEVAPDLAGLQSSLPGSPGADYLTQRGLAPDTWGAYLLGYSAAMNAIALPWYRGGRLCGVRYRRLQPRPGQDKLISETGSNFTDLLFGAQALCPDWHTLLPNGFDPLSRRSLILVEGEINAMSIWQELYPAAVDVLSFGSESTHIPDAVLPIARRYRAVLVWKDKESFARAEAAKVDGAGAYWSEGETGKRDANDHLRAGTLVALVAKLLKAITPESGQEGLHWDLWDLEHGEGAARK